MSDSSLERPIPNGAAWAAILAAGIGCFAYGVFIDLGEASPRWSNALNFYNPVGNLSGKTTLGIVVWLIAWVILHLRWRKRDLARPGRVTTIAVVLILLGVIASCPLFFELLTR